MRHPLYRVSELDRLPRDDFLNAHWKPIRRIMDWTCDYLCKSHPDLGRRGPVCPFVGPSMEKDLFFLTVHPGRHFGQEELRDLMLSYRDVFVDLEPKTGEDAQFKTILVLFPDIPPESTHLIDETQAELSEEFAPRGLMIGEFHAGPPNKPGLWNEAFRPLFSPIPMLVIRHMVPTDILFLKRAKSLFQAYLKVYGDKIPPRMFKYAREASKKYQVELRRQGAPS